MPVNNPPPTPENVRLSLSPEDPKIAEVLTTVLKIAQDTRSYAYQFYRTNDGTKLEIRALGDRDAWFLTPVDESGKKTSEPVQYGTEEPFDLPDLPQRPALTPPETPPKRPWWKF